MIVEVAFIARLFSLLSVPASSVHFSLKTGWARNKIGMNSTRRSGFVLIVWASCGGSDWDFLLSTVLICIVDSIALFIVIIVIHILLSVDVVYLL